LLCGRGDRVPPRKRPFTLSQGLPSKLLYRRLAVQRRGGLRTPPISASRLTEACPHWATGRSLAPDRYVVPRPAYGLATQTRRPASLRENHFSRHFRAFPARRPTLPLASRSTSKGVPLGQADKIFPYISLPHRFPTHVGQQPLRKNTPLPRPGPRVCVKSWDQRISGIHHVEQRGET
jgi:hypothetical protein